MAKNTIFIIQMNITSENNLTKNENYLIVDTEHEDIAFILLLNKKVSRIKSSRV